VVGVCSLRERMRREDDGFFTERAGCQLQVQIKRVTWPNDS
jgi:hypothetical protein